MVPEDREPGRRVLLWSLALAVAVVVVYARSAQGGLLWDDRDLAMNGWVMGSWEGLGRIWRGQGTTDFYPLTFTSFWIEWRLWSGDPFGYRLVNLGLHLASAWVLWRVLHRLEVPGARWAALLFAVHPLAVTSVAWIAERKNVLSMLLSLLAVRAALEVPVDNARARPAGRDAAIDSARARPTGRAAIAAATVFVLALLAKTAPVGLPVVILAIWWWKGEPLRPRAWALLVAMLLASALLGLVTTGYHEADYPLGPWPTRVVRAAQIAWFYAAKAAWPSGLAMLYPRHFLFEAPLLGVAAFGALVALVALVVARRERWGKGPVVVVVSTIALLAPVLGLVPIAIHRATFVADHHAYFALPVLVAAAVAVAARVSPARHGPAALAVACVLSFRSLAYAETMRSPAAMWKNTVEQSPGVALGWANAAFALADEGRREEAMRHALRAVEVDPENADARAALGIALVDAGRFAEAEAELRTALARDGSLAFARNNLAALLMHRGDVSGAIEELTRAVTSKPGYALGHMNLARLLAVSGRSEEAREHHGRAIEIDASLAGQALPEPTTR